MNSISTSSPDIVQWMLLGEPVSATEEHAVPRCLAVLQCVLLSFVQINCL